MLVSCSALDSDEDKRKKSNQAVLDGEKIVSRLGSLEEEYDEMHKAVYDFLNLVIKEFPGRKLNDKEVKTEDSLAKFTLNNGMDAKQRPKSKYINEGFYIVDIENINNDETISRIFELAKQVFNPLGFKSNDIVPSKKTSEGFINFSWMFSRDSSIPESKISWPKVSHFLVSGEKNLVVSFNTDTRFPEGKFKTRIPRN